MKHITKLAIILAAVASLSVNILAATPLYKPVKLPSYTITLPKMDFSAAVDAYLKEHPIT